MHFDMYSDFRFIRNTQINMKEGDVNFYAQIEIRKQKNLYLQLDKNTL